MEQHSDEKEVRAAIREFCKTADLDATSHRSVRRSVAAKLGIDLEARKAWVKTLTTEVLAQLSAEAEAERDDSGSEDGGSGSGSDGDEADDARSVATTSSRRSGYMRLLTLSDGLAALFGEAQMQRSEATKRLWQVIKERELPKDKRGSYILDDEMQSVFKRKTLNFKSISKALSSQMYDTKYSSRNVDWAHEEEEEAAPAKKKRKAKSAATASKPASSKKARKAKGGSGTGSGLNKGMRLSPELASFMHGDEASRPQVVKALWAHIKSNNLQRESDKRTIDCDSVLKGLLGEDVVTMFSMNKFISKHFIGPGTGEGVVIQDDEETIRKREAKKQARQAKPKGAKTKRAPSTSGLNKPKRLSSEMATFIGESEASRPQVVKALWAHIKAHGLQREGDKRTIDCDNTLKALLGQDEVTMFSMNKYIGQHFIKE